MRDPAHKGTGNYPFIVRKVDDPIWARVDDTLLGYLLHQSQGTPEEQPEDWDPFEELRNDVSLWPDEEIQMHLRVSDILELADFLDEYLPPLGRGYIPPEADPRIVNGIHVEVSRGKTTTPTVTIEDLEIDLGLRSPSYPLTWKESNVLDREHAILGSEKQSKKSGERNEESGDDRAPSVSIMSVSSSPRAPVKLQRRNIKSRKSGQKMGKKAERKIVKSRSKKR